MKLSEESQRNFGAACSPDVDLTRTDTGEYVALHTHILWGMYQCGYHEARRVAAKLPAENNAAAHTVDRLKEELSKANKDRTQMGRMLEGYHKILMDNNIPASSTDIISAMSDVNGIMSENILLRRALHELAKASGTCLKEVHGVIEEYCEGCDCEKQAL